MPMLGSLFKEVYYVVYHASQIAGYKLDLSGLVRNPAICFIITEGIYCIENLACRQKKTLQISS